MSSSSQRQRAEAAFGHLQQAAGEMIAAAHDALDMVEQAVSTGGFDDLLDAFNHLGRSVFSWRPPQGGPPPRPGGDPADPAGGTSAAAAPGDRRRRSEGDGPVERIPVR